MVKLKIGDIVKAIKPVGLDKKINITGKIIDYTYDMDKSYLVEFYEKIGGHKGNGLAKVEGKDKHCWWCKAEELQLADSNKEFVRSKGKIIFDTLRRRTTLKVGKKSVSVQCDSYDTFNKEKGVLLCIAKANGYIYDDIQHLIDNAEIATHSKFNVGDFVFVQDTGKTYTTYDDWFKIYNLGLHKKYQRDSLPVKKNQYKVVAKGKHENQNKMLYAIQDLDGNVYLIGEKGLIKEK
jgi:hypothetical protein